MPFGGLNFSAPYHLFTALKNGFFVWISYFLSLFLAQLPSKLSKYAEITYVHLVKMLNVSFVGFRFSGSKFSYAQFEEREC